MHASVEPVDIMHTALGQSAKAFVLNQATRFMATCGSYRCKACGKRCEVEVQYEGAHVAHSKGQCRTPGCIGWEE
jgi:hypothetical protein